ncbi:MAG: DUF2318 domain-containing protein [Deltaproteobacteria bacterium]|nr:DUF2318 domain-containing protein [Deltaproteobacteria bacterium]
MKLTRLTTILIIVALAIGAAAAIGPMMGPGCTQTQDTYVVTVPTGDLARGSAKFYCYRNHDGQLVRFVLARGHDGIVHSVFDACRQCYRFHKGFTVDDGFLVCRLCGNRYKLDDMRVGLASCQPVHLESVESGAKVQVKVAALEQGSKLF